MFRVLFGIFVCLLLPGLAALGFSLWEGPANWALNENLFWGLPVSLFVFWVGLAHAGTLLSAIFLALDVKLDRRTSMLAELATLCALAVAVVYPLMHLGIVQNFYMVFPFADSRGCLANVRSPLVWDFCCILAYGVLSAIYFWIHLQSDALPAVAKLRRPMAWLLFPLVLWVHTVVSLDFAVTFVPAWRGAYFPIYFILGAIYSGLALVNILLCAEGYRVRLLEKLMLVGSWFLGAMILWDMALKGSSEMLVLVFAVVLPQLLFVSAVRETVAGRLCVCASIIVGLFLERLLLLFPSEIAPLHWQDYGLIVFGVGLFAILFFVARIKLSHAIEGEEVLMGELEESRPKVVEKEHRYFPPLTTPEFRTLRIPLLCGIVACVLFIIWVVSGWLELGIDFSAENIVPMTYPVVAVVACLVLCVRPFLNALGKRAKIFFVIIAAVVGFAAGAFYVGSDSNASNVETRGEVGAYSLEHVGGRALELQAKTVFESRCSGCHGLDGRLNEKFVREFYPVPQVVNSARLDSLGEDSLVNVVLNGRTNMNSYAGRITPQMARSLVRYMRSLADMQGVEQGGVK